MESDFLATMFPFFPAVFPAMDPTIPYEATTPSIHLHLGWQPRLSPGTDLPVGFTAAVLTVKGQRGA